MKSKKVIKLETFLKLILKKKYFPGKYSRSLDM